MGFYGQGNTAVYFTFSAPLLIHYSKRSIKIATKKARGLFLFLLLCQILYSRAHPLYKKKGSFIAEKDNKLSGVLQHLLLDDIIHSMGSSMFFYIMDAQIVPQQFWGPPSSSWHHIIFLPSSFISCVSNLLLQPPLLLVLLLLRLLILLLLLLLLLPLLIIIIVQLTLNFLNPQQTSLIENKAFSKCLFPSTYSI